MLRCAVKVHPSKVPQSHNRVRVVTLNMHKGVSALHAHSTVYRLKQEMRSYNPDHIFIQEF